MFSKKRLFYSLIILIIVILAVLLINKLTGSDNETKIIERDFPAIKESGELNVVTDYNNINYYASGDSIAGFTKDMLKAFAQHTGLKIIITLENDLQRSIDGLKNGQYDLVARNIPINNSLKGQIAFTQPLVRNKLVLVQRVAGEDDENEIIRNHLRLAKKTIYVPRSSPAMLRLQNLAHEIGDTIYVLEDSLYEAPQLIMKVAAGEIDYAVVDAEIANILQKTNPEVDINTDIGFTHLEAWAVRNSSPMLLDSINTWLDSFLQTNAFKTIYNKYYK